jgi:hypothetical protein
LLKIADFLIHKQNSEAAFSSTAATIEKIDARFEKKERRFFQK